MQMASQGKGNYFRHVSVSQDPFLSQSRSTGALCSWGLSSRKLQMDRAAATLQWPGAFLRRSVHQQYLSLAHFRLKWLAPTVVHEALRLLPLTLLPDSSQIHLSFVRVTTFVKVQEPSFFFFLLAEHFSVAVIDFSCFYLQAFCGRWNIIMQCVEVEIACVIGPPKMNEKLWGCSQGLHLDCYTLPRRMPTLNQGSREWGNNILRWVADTAGTRIVNDLWDRRKGQ